MAAPEQLLRDDEIALIASCLLAAEEGPFFSDWEFQTLFGIERSELAEVRQRWPNVDLGEEQVECAVMNSMVMLIMYPHGVEDALRAYVPGGRKEIERLLATLDH
jgi:hypothetical protein